LQRRQSSARRFTAARRLRQREICEHEVGQAQAGRHEERQPQIHVTEHAAERGPRNETHAESRAIRPKLCARFSGGVTSARYAPAAENSGAERAPRSFG